MFYRMAGLAVAAALLPQVPALAQQKTLRIAMTSADVPITNGVPNQGYEGTRFLGYPVFETLILWDLTHTDRLAPLRPGLAERWEQDAADPKVWRFHLRAGVKFHDNTDFTAESVIWSLDRYFKNDSPQFDAAGAAVVRGRVPGITGYRRVDDRTVEITTARPISYFPYLSVYLPITSPAAWEAAGRDYARLAQAPAGTGPFRITRFTPRQSVELTRNEANWTAAGWPSWTASSCNPSRMRIPGWPRCAVARWTGSRCRRLMRSPACVPPASPSPPAATRMSGPGSSAPAAPAAPPRMCACARR